MNLKFDIEKSVEVIDMIFESSKLTSRIQNYNSMTSRRDFLTKEFVISSVFPICHCKRIHDKRGGHIMNLGDVAYVKYFMDYTWRDKFIVIFDFDKLKPFINNDVFKEIIDLGELFIQESYKELNWGEVLKSFDQAIKSRLEWTVDALNGKIDESNNLFEYLGYMTSFYIKKDKKGTFSLKEAHISGDDGLPF